MNSKIYLALILVVATVLAKKPCVDQKKFYETLEYYGNVTHHPDESISIEHNGTFAMDIEYVKFVKYRGRIYTKAIFGYCTNESNFDPMPNCTDMIGLEIAIQRVDQYYSKQTNSEFLFRQDNFSPMLYFPNTIINEEGYFMRIKATHSPCHRENVTNVPHVDDSIADDYNYDFNYDNGGHNNHVIYDNKNNISCNDARNVGVSNGPVEFFVLLVGAIMIK